MNPILSVAACALFLLTGCGVVSTPPTSAAPSPRFSAAAAYDGARQPYAPRRLAAWAARPPGRLQPAAS